MVLKLIRSIAVLGIALMMPLAAPVTAHQEHNETNAAAAAEQRPGAPRPTTPGAMQEMMEEHAAQMEEQTPRSFAGRLARWLGQMHPFAVHFPIALIPVSWLALIIARRRGDAVDLIRAFVIVAGAAAVVASALGWLSAILAPGDPDPFLEWHRWIGTGLGVFGAVIAVWSWRRASSVNSRYMVWLLGAATLVLLVQGWLGAVIVHGMEHMAF